MSLEVLFGFQLGFEYFTGVLGEDTDLEILAERIWWISEEVGSRGVADMQIVYQNIFLLTGYESISTWLFVSDIDVDQDICHFLHFIQVVI